MEAQIVKCCNESYWYNNRIGERFEVFEQSVALPFTSVFDKDGKAKIVSNEDVIIVN